MAINLKVRWHKFLRGMLRRPLLSATASFFFFALIISGVFFFFEKDLGPPYDSYPAAVKAELPIGFDQDAE